MNLAPTISLINLQIESINIISKNAQIIIIQTFYPRIWFLRADSKFIVVEEENKSVLDTFPVEFLPGYWRIAT